MTNEDKSRNLEAWEQYFKKHPNIPERIRRLAEEQRGHMPPDTRPTCPGVDEAGPCKQPASAGGHCAAHYADGVL